MNNNEPVTKVTLYTVEWYPVYCIDITYDDTLYVEMPEDLYNEYKNTHEKFLKYQEELSDLFEQMNKGE